GPRNKNHRINWDRTIIDEPLDWTFEQFENRKLGAMIERAGYPGIAADLDLDKIGAVLPALKKRSYEMYAEGERLTGHKGLPLEFTPNFAAEEPADVGGAPDRLLAAAHIANGIAFPNAAASINMAAHRFGGRRLGQQRLSEHRSLLVRLPSETGRSDPTTL